MYDLRFCFLNENLTQAYKFKTNSTSIYFNFELLHNWILLV